MKADETEKDWKRRCFNEQQLPICSGSPGTYTAGTLQYYTGAPWAQLRSGSGCVGVGEWEVVWACVGSLGVCSAVGVKSHGTMHALLAVLTGPFPPLARASCGSGREIVCGAGNTAQRTD